MRIVVKIGSSIVAGARAGLNTRRIAALAAAISSARAAGHQPVLVSSGAVAAGMLKLRMRKRPSDIKLKQAAASVGQPSLMWAYERGFAAHKEKVAQVLLTRDGLSDRKMYINAKNTLFTLLDYGVIPVVNENDTVATEEIRFGDNDHLAALVASLVEADRLIMLSDVDGLYTANPARDRRARLIKTVEKVDADVMGLAGGSGSAVGTGGMYSKLLAARMAAQNGIGVNIINGRRPRLLAAVLQGGNPGTEFKPERGRLSARKGWIAHGIRAKGALELDAGAVKALREGRKSLLPSGVLRMQGSFQAGDAVYCLDPQGNRIAKGVSNYSSDEVKRIMGRKTSEIEAALGYKYSDEIIHRDNMVIL